MSHDTPKLNFFVYECHNDDTPDYDAEVLASIEAADKLLTHHRAPFGVPDRIGYTNIPVLEFLKDRPWDQYALNMVWAVRPSCIRVTTGTITADSVNWRVTVVLHDDCRTIHKITQEVEVGLTGAKHGYGLHKYQIGADPKPQSVFINTRGIDRLELLTKD